MIYHKVAVSLWDHWDDPRIKIVEYIIRGESKEDILRKAEARWPTAASITLREEVLVLE